MKNKFLLILLFLSFIPLKLSAFSIDCHSNKDCMENEYCTYEGQCKYNDGTIELRKNIPNIGNVWIGLKQMSWIDAKNYCLSHKKKLLDITGNKLQCYKQGITPFGDNLRSIGYCCGLGTPCEENHRGWENFSAPVQVLIDGDVGTKTIKKVAYLNRNGRKTPLTSYNVAIRDLWFDTPYNFSNKLYFNRDKIDFADPSRKIAHPICVEDTVEVGSTESLKNFLNLENSEKQLVFISLIIFFLVLFGLIFFKSRKKH